MRTIVGSILLSLLIPSHSFAQQPTIAQSPTTPSAHGQSLKRMGAAWNAYADTYKLDRMFITYCQGEMELHTYQYRSNGNYMFSFNYNKHPLLDESAQAAISFREQYEMSYILICLAGIKKALDSAKSSN
jgi:hypothetical protein